MGMCPPPRKRFRHLILLPTLDMIARRSTPDGDRNEDRPRTSLRGEPSNYNTSASLSDRIEVAGEGLQNQPAGNGTGDPVLVPRGGHLNDVDRP